MAQLIVRNLDEDLVRSLKVRAAQHSRSAEAEHREILRQALAPKGSTVPIKELLLALPDVGDDAVFERVDELPRDVEL